jgi:hypothetical protein
MKTAFDQTIQSGYKAVENTANFLKNTTLALGVVGVAADIAKMTGHEGFWNQLNPCENLDAPALYNAIINAKALVDPEGIKNSCTALTQGLPKTNPQIILGLFIGAVALGWYSFSQIEKEAKNLQKQENKLPSLHPFIKTNPYHHRSIVELL